MIMEIFFCMVVYPFGYLYHNVSLTDSEHKIKLVVKGEKNPKSEGAEITIRSAVIYGPM
jgi:hypothetical protein